jgi:membrane associated rhomboid family serine protease
MFDSGHYAAPAIMILTAGISLLGMYQIPDIINRFLFRPYFFLRERQYETMIMSGFIHADIGHLLFNMITFYFFAFPLERFLGTTRFVILYFVGLVISHTCTWYKERNNPQYPTTTLFIIPIPFPIPAALFAVGYVAYSWWASKNSNDRINHDAHLCGAFSGIGFVAATDLGAFTRLISTFS